LVGVDDGSDVGEQISAPFGSETPDGLFARRMEKFDPLWFEEPAPPENVDELARIARATSIPVATSERLATKFEFRALLEKQAGAILQMASPFFAQLVRQRILVQLFEKPGASRVQDLECAANDVLRQPINLGFICAQPGRRGCCHPRPPQTRTCRFPASGSSRESFARSASVVGALADVAVIASDAWRVAFVFAASSSSAASSP